MRPWTSELSGWIDERTIDSKALIGNPLGDSSTRPIWVYLPPDYDTSPTRRYPCVYLLQGYAAALPKWAHRPAFGRTMPERIDAVFADRDTPPCIVVFVDAWTSLGGSQFIDSPAIGNYHQYLCEDIVPFVDEHYRTLAAPAHRALQGHSSGGFGALVNAMMRPDLFGGVASHAGDSAYDLCYPTEIAIAYRALRDYYDRSYENFFSDFAIREPLSRPTDFSLVMVYALSACFSPTADGAVELPFDRDTGALIPSVWRRWLDWDPIAMVPHYAEALRSMRAMWIDAGRADEYYFDIGAERLVQACREVGLTEISFELFEGRHSGIEHRYPLALRYLAERLTPE